MLAPLRALALAGLAALALPSLVAGQGTSTSGTGAVTNSQASATSNAPSNSATSLRRQSRLQMSLRRLQSWPPDPSRARSLVSRPCLVWRPLSGSHTPHPIHHCISHDKRDPKRDDGPIHPPGHTVDPTFGVLGCLLILTGIPTAFGDTKTDGLFGVLDAINPPSKVVRGMFLLASAVAGVVGGGLSIFFWKHTKYFIGAWGVSPLHSGYSASGAVVGFVLCTIPKLHYNILLISTAIVGASATILGVDCFTTAGLKEFYLWNLGFMRMFPVFYNIGMPYPLYQTEQIELGLIAAVALMGGRPIQDARCTQKRLQEITEQRKREEDAEIAAAERLGAFDEHLDEWEKRHGNRFSLLNGFKDTPTTPAVAHTRGDYFAVPLQSPKAAVIAPEPATAGISGRPQSIGSPGSYGGCGQASEETEASRRRQELLAEIDAIKKNIAQLKAEGVSNSSGSRSASTVPRDSEPARSRTVSFDALRTPVQVHAPPESEWDQYVRERKLFTPPSGVTAPIPSAALPEAVAEAVEMRKRRESMLEMGQLAMPWRLLVSLLLGLDLTHEPLRKAEAELPSLRTQRADGNAAERSRSRLHERKMAEEAADKKGRRFSKMFGGNQPSRAAAQQAADQDEEEPEGDLEKQERRKRHSRHDSAATKVAAWQAYQEQTAKRPSGDAPRRSGDGLGRRSGDSRHRQSAGPILPHQTHTRQMSGSRYRDAPN
ncbi:hypothetical protein RhiLY_03811 [Ceratobasidium sp. AG-Ba]|nr:hypothetical protein RhiLY_03811 [Ceratobasidium sp. AG-Ba]